MKTKGWWDSSVRLPDDWRVTRLEMVERLKKNERPFGLLSAAEQEVMRECEVEMYNWFGKWTYCPGAPFAPEDELNRVCRVRADFVPVYEESKPQCDCRNYDSPTCGSVQPTDTGEPAYKCTRPRGHDGDHVACGERVHRYASWPQVPKPPQLDPNEAPEGYVAELYNGNCSSCAFWYCGGVGKAKNMGHPCGRKDRNDGCEVILVKKPQSEWGEWQEYQVEHPGNRNGRIRFKKEK